MMTILVIILGIAVASCMMPPPQLPRQGLPRQALPAPEPRAELQSRASELTPGMIGKYIQKGKTTQAEIIEIFGPRDMVTRTGSGEMWGYDKVSREVAEAATGARVGAASSSGARVGGGGLIGGAGVGVLGGVLGGIGGSMGQSASQSQQQSQQQARRVESTTTVLLLVYYDDKGIVTDYRLSATKF